MNVAHAVVGITASLSSLKPIKALMKVLFPELNSPTRARYNLGSRILIRVFLIWSLISSNAEPSSCESATELR